MLTNFSLLVFNGLKKSLEEPENKIWVLYFALSGWEQGHRLHQTGQTCPLIWISPLYFNLERSRCRPAPFLFPLRVLLFLIPNRRCCCCLMFVKSCHQFDLEMAFNWVLLGCRNRVPSSVRFHSCPRGIKLLTHARRKKTEKDETTKNRENFFVTKVITNYHVHVCVCWKKGSVPSGTDLPSLFIAWSIIVKIVSLVNWRQSRQILHCLSMKIVVFDFFGSINMQITVLRWPRVLYRSGLAVRLMLASRLLGKSTVSLSLSQCTVLGCFWQGFAGRRESDGPQQLTFLDKWLISLDR